MDFMRSAVQTITACCLNCREDTTRAVSWAWNRDRNQTNWNLFSGWANRANKFAGWTTKTKYRKQPSDQENKRGWWHERVCELTSQKRRADGTQLHCSADQFVSFLSADCGIVHNSSWMFTKCQSSNVNHEIISPFRNIIDVAALDTHLLEQSEYNDRVKIYAQRLAHQWNNIQVNDAKYNGRMWLDLLKLSFLMRHSF